MQCCRMSLMPTSCRSLIWSWRQMLSRLLGTCCISIMCTYCIPSLTTQVQFLALPDTVPPAALLSICNSSHQCSGKCHVAQDQSSKPEICRLPGKWVARCSMLCNNTVRHSTVSAIRGKGRSFCYISILQDSRSYRVLPGLSYNASVICPVSLSLLSDGCWHVMLQTPRRF